MDFQNVSMVAFPDATKQNKMCEKNQGDAIDDDTDTFVYM